MFTGHGGSPLHDAVHDRNVARVRALLAEGADPNALDAGGNPPLRHVLTYGIGFVLERESREMIAALLAAGADPSLNGTAAALVADASSMVTSAGEAGEARELEAMLAIPGK
jgi:ankyrin repeat protein